VRCEPIHVRRPDRQTVAGVEERSVDVTEQGYSRQRISL